jgi:hypothetical protein
MRCGSLQGGVPSPSEEDPRTNKEMQRRTALRPRRLNFDELDAADAGKEQASLACDNEFPQDKNVCKAGRCVRRSMQARSEAKKQGAKETAAPTGIRAKLRSSRMRAADVVDAVADLFNVEPQEGSPEARMAAAMQTLKCA